MQPTGRALKQRVTCRQVLQPLCTTRQQGCSKQGSRTLASRRAAQMVATGLPADKLT